MATHLKSTAVKTVNNVQPCSYYSTEKPNPVLQAFDQEIDHYVSYMKKRSAAGYKQRSDEAHSRPADTLFALWNKYEPRLPKLLFQGKLLDMGDFLVSIKEVSLAQWQCYDRYLSSYEDVNMEEVTEPQLFQEAFFPNGFDTEDAAFTYRALMGKSSCTYLMVKMTDPKLQNVESVEKCLRLMSFIRLIMQVILPREKLCWLVYNGTVHLYSISRHLMNLGHSAKVLEYLLWACMSMEGSIPLLSVRYLSWRSTLYTAVCQSYYDCRAGMQAEAFARRALSKISELSQLENMSSSQESGEVEAAFREATLRMSAMIFKRSVFETRKKPKGLLRPKTRANLKEAAQLPWPRTMTEKLLVMTVEGSAAQSVCVLDALSDSNRRILLCMHPACDSDIELLDVYIELFMAGQELIAGGGGTGTPAENTINVSVPGVGGVLQYKSVFPLAVKGENGVSLSFLVKLTKLAYCYCQWEALDHLLPTAIMTLQELDLPGYRADLKALEILKAYDRVVPRSKQRKMFNTPEDEDRPESGAAPAEKGPPRSPGSTLDDIVSLAEVLLSVIKNDYTQEEMDMDMMVDAVLLLWNKCKFTFQKFQTGSTDNHRYLSRMDHPGKWVYILDIVHQVICWTGLSSIDPALTSEVVLRLALVFEASASLQLSNEVKAKSVTIKSTPNRSRDPEEDTVVSTVKDMTESVILSVSEGVSPRTPHQSSSAPPHSTLLPGIHDNLLQARDILRTGLAQVSHSRAVVAQSDGKSVAEISWAKDLNTVDVSDQDTDTESKALSETDSVTTGKVDSEPALSGDATSVGNLVKDLHTELVFMFHHISLRLASLLPDQREPGAVKDMTKKNATKAAFCQGQLDVDSYQQLVDGCLSDRLSKALLYMQRALALSKTDVPKTQLDQLFKDSMVLIRKVEAEERKLYTENVLQEKPVTKSQVPPPPVLMCRTDTYMVLRPAPFQSTADHKVAWYRVFARPATGNNVKVRLNDYHLPGTGEEVPAAGCELRVRGLHPRQKYMFAVAAYTAQGDLIGGSIGESTRPILASHPTPPLMAWAYLCQTAYQAGCYDMAQQACAVLWSHFVAEPPSVECATYTTRTQNDFKLTLHRLNQAVVSQSSPVLLRLFLSSIFISVDIKVKQDQLYCDKLCDKGPALKSQVQRLLECEKMLVAMEMAGWLNEYNQALQAVVQCYGLLTPVIYYKIPSQPAIQVLERCLSVLQEVPVHLRQRRTTAMNDSLHHMIACMVYHMARVLRNLGQRSLSLNINDMGRRLLDKDKTDGTDLPGLLPMVDESEQGSMPLPHPPAKKSKSKKGAPLPGTKEDGTVIGNEELKALEAHIMKYSKQAQSDQTLTGNEDPSILHAYIAYLPSKNAYNEVVKFKRRARFLEFFVHCCQKALAEGAPQQVLGWCNDTIQWLHKRNENIVGVKTVVAKQFGAMTVVGDDTKTYQAALVAYSKSKKPPLGHKGPSDNLSDIPRVIEERDKTPRRKEQPGKPVTRKTKYKPIGVTKYMTDSQRKAQEELEYRAIEILSRVFVDYHLFLKNRRKFRRITTDESPWHSQLCMVMALSQFGVFLQKMETKEKLQRGAATSYIYSTSFLESQWFTFETAGTLVVGWSGTKKRDSFVALRQSQSETVHKLKDTNKASGIEIAAAMATGSATLVSQSLQSVEDDTPRTYDSNASSPWQRKKKQVEESLTMLSADEAVEMLRGCFTNLTQAVVLAHRSGYFTLLQNACRAMWNCTHSALVCIQSPDSRNQPFLEVETLRSLVWKPLWMAVDCLLDMLVQLQAQQDSSGKKKPKKGGQSPDKPPLVNSWMGGVSSDRGGASLKFDTPTDDVSLVDMHVISQMTLRVLELLYYEEKWERLVDIALRFNALSDDRFAQQVNPLMAQAQRHLTERIAENGGHPPPQPHFVGGIMSPKDYISTQLMVNVKDDELSQINAGAQIDPKGHDAYSGGVHARRLCCVPLDVSYTLHCLREALEVTRYTSRALRHSRRLLVLYLATHNRVVSSDASLARSDSIGFAPTTARPQPIMPPDISRDEFLSPDDVKTCTLPPGQVGLVMKSYDKTIEILLAGGEKGLAAEAMKEMGNLHYHAGNIRMAYKWWSESLDILLGVQNAVQAWPDLLSSHSDPSAYLLDKCGLWGCILGGVLTSNIAQYILTTDLGQKTECCFLSGYFFKALFRSSLPHPTADRDYAVYEVGAGCEVTNLVPGVDLLSERFRSDGRSLVAALKFIMDELYQARHNLFMLPLLTLYQYLTTFVCRDLQHTVEGRILKVHVLTDLGLISEAVTTILSLIQGERLPQSADSHFRQVESRPFATKFDNQKPLKDPTNLKVLEAVLTKRLSSSLSMLYGPHLTCHLSLAQCHLLITIAGTINMLPKYMDTESESAHTISTGSTGKLASQKSTSNRSIKAKSSKSVEAEKKSSLLLGDKEPELVEIKGKLLSTADQILTAISEVLVENALQDRGLENMQAAELEVVIQAKLLLAEISHQRHHATMAARIVLSAILLLQNSSIFSENKQTFTATRLSSKTQSYSTHVQLVQPPSDQYEYKNSQSRSHLNARTWLQCRRALVKCMLGEVNNMGLVKGEIREVKCDMAEVGEYCTAGLTESEACGDVEMKAEFLLYSAHISQMKGKPSQETRSLLEELLRLLTGVQHLSGQGQLMMALTLTHLADLETAERQSSDSVMLSELCQVYCNAQDLLLKQLESLGEVIERRYDNQREFSCPDSPLSNIYLPQLLAVVQVKLRIGHTMARQTGLTAKHMEESESVYEWRRALGVLTTALSLSQVIAGRVLSIEAELLFNMGRVGRQLCLLGQSSPQSVASTLLEAIKASHATSHDLGLMRLAYLELSLLYLTSCGQLRLTDSVLQCVPRETSTVTPSHASVASGKESAKSARRKSKKITPEKAKTPETEQEREQLAAWIAIRCAGMVGQTMRTRGLLIGQPNITNQIVGEEGKQELPDFVVVDLVAQYVVGTKNPIYKNQIEEEMAPLLEELEPPVVETYNEQMNKARQAAADLNWIHVLGYQAMLERLHSLSALTAAANRTEDQNQKTKTEDHEENILPDFDLGFISHSESDFSREERTIRSSIFGVPWSLRLGYLHQCLTKTLPSYAEECIAIYPPTQLLTTITSAEEQISPDLITKVYLQPESLKPDSSTSVIPESGNPSSVSIESTKTSKTSTVSSTTSLFDYIQDELCLHWYAPAYDNRAREQEEAGEQIMMLYAGGKVPAVRFSGMMWISLSQLYDLHDRLVAITQRAEIYLTEEEKKSATSASPTKSRKQARIKAVASKPKRDEQLEALLKQCMVSCQLLLGTKTETEILEEQTMEETDQQSEAKSPTKTTPEAALKPTPEIPFDVDKKTLYDLEQLFDPDFGFNVAETKLLFWLMSIFPAV